MRMRKFPYHDQDGNDVGTLYVMRQASDSGREADIKVIVTHELPRALAVQFVLEERKNLREFIRKASS